MDHHIVRQGETLSAIAHRYGTTAAILARLNNIADPNRMAIGRRLLVPGARDATVLRVCIPACPGVGASGVRSQTDTAAPRSAAPSAAGADVTEQQIRAIMPNSGDRATTYVAPLNAAMRAHGIDTFERRAAFLAQISVESGQLRNTEENLTYTTTARLRAVWPRRFPTDEAARPYVRNPEGLANLVYGGRAELGNGDAASGDGYRFRGRGLMQTTGRANYRAAGYEDRPEALAQPDTAADSAGRFWSDNGLNTRATRELGREQFDRVSRTVNGGNHGSDERWQTYQRALRTLRPVPAVPGG